MAEQAADPLLAELRNMLDHADPVPAAVVTAAKESFAWRTIDADLAELATDSLEIVGAVRGADAARLLTFRAADLEVEVEVAETGATRRLTGQLVPTGPARMSVRWPGGTLQAEADELGRFAIEGVPAGPVSLAVWRPGATDPVVTSWIAV